MPPLGRASRNKVLAYGPRISHCRGGELRSMKYLCLAALGLVLAGCGSTTTKTVTVVRTVPQKLGGNSDQQFFGHVKSIAQAKGGYLVSFDPSWLVTGITANVA